MADRQTRADRSRTFPPLPARAEGPFAASWWGSAWVDALESTALDGARLDRGRAYAREGHVDTINVTPGRIVATVRGSRPRPYSAEIRLRTLSGQEWDDLLGAVAADPTQLAALLAKKLPSALAEGDVRLLPGPGDLVPRCSCPDLGRPCKHAAALCFQVARLLDADPFVLLLMRGRGERELLDELSRRHATLTAHTAAETATHTAPTARHTARTARHTADGSRAAQMPGPAADSPAPGSLTREAPVPDTPLSDAPSPAASAPGEPAGVLARDALADRHRPPLPPPLALPEHPGRPPALPDADGLPVDPAALEFLAADAAARAHAFLSFPAAPPAPSATGSAATGSASAPAAPGGERPPVRSPFPQLPVWQDAVRLAATAHPTAGLTSATRALYRDLAAATGRTSTEVARSVAAWRQGGPEGLALLDTTWNPPAGDFDRARSALIAADLPSLRPRHNHLTDPLRRIQLRYGRDHRWYPYESEPGAEDWWPTGPADPDPVGALTTLLAR
ncbi:zinc finger SWIM domain-containing protein [Streptomyces natalensis ATCC 27448]|uniref:Zinc finger SWIM domain-containing protein n=1 Tax=Streptomyces natalensis ATCC 27448 TaxID=1240678 RepID=A0A0D7CQ27_9ACTN|nr:zinc finger SWIM domain-containing protein [Streptomyces natalensis ATCC 27448]